MPVSGKRTLCVTRAQAQEVKEQYETGYWISYFGLRSQGDACLKYTPMNSSDFHTERSISLAAEHKGMVFKPMKEVSS